jgi:hypothetical protein
VLTPAIQLAAIRIALGALDPPLSPFDRWTRYLDCDVDGNMTVDVESLVERVLQQKGRIGERVAVDAHRQDVEVDVGNDPFLLVRGHDFVTILYQLLRSTWGRRIAGPNVKAWSEGRLSRILLLGLPPDNLDATECFGSVKAQLS